MKKCPKCSHPKADGVKRCECGHDFERAALQALAEAGDANAQYRLGVAFGYGDKNSIESVKWYRKAADQGHPDAQFELGRHLVTGQGLPEDVSAGLRWMRLAAENVNEHAVWLGLLYEEGSSKIPQNYSEAAKFYRMAADQGEPISQERLGHFYENGIGVPQDRIQALDWYRKAASHGLEKAQAKLGITYYLGEGVPQDFAEALQWFRRAAEQGHRGAQYQVGHMIFHGHGTKSDKSEAAQWFEKAAEQGQKEAQFMLARMLEQGDGVSKNLKKAIDFYYMAAERGQPNAQAWWGMRLAMSGAYVEGVKWVELSAANGNPTLMRARNVAFQNLPKEVILAGQQLAANWESKEQFDIITPLSGKAVTTYEKTLKLAVEMESKEKQKAAYCRFCGEPTDSRDQFCGKCGKIR